MAGGRQRLSIEPAQLKATAKLTQQLAEIQDAFVVAVSVAVEAAETDEIGIQLLHEALQPILPGLTVEQILKSVTLGRMHRLRGRSYQP